MTRSLEGINCQAGLKLVSKLNEISLPLHRSQSCLPIELEKGREDPKVNLGLMERANTQLPGMARCDLRMCKKIGRMSHSITVGHQSHFTPRP